MVSWSTLVFGCNVSFISLSYMSMSGIILSLRGMVTWMPVSYSLGKIYCSIIWLINLFFIDKRPSGPVSSPWYPTPLLSSPLFSLSSHVSIRPEPGCWYPSVGGRSRSNQSPSLHGSSCKRDLFILMSYFLQRTSWSWSGWWTLLHPKTVTATRGNAVLLHRIEFMSWCSFLWDTGYGAITYDLLIFCLW